MHPALYRTRISFIPIQLIFPFLKYDYWTSDIEKTRSNSCVRSQFKVETWVQYPIDSHPFGSMSIRPLIPMIELFLNLTFKIQGQSQSSRSHTMHNIISTHIPSVSCWSALLFLKYSYFKNWPWKSMVKVTGEFKVPSHNVSLASYWLPSLWFHANRPTHSWYHIFKVWQKKHQKVDIAPYQLISISFHVDQPSHS